MRSLIGKNQAAIGQLQPKTVSYNVTGKKSGKNIVCELTGKNEFKKYAITATKQTATTPIQIEPNKKLKKALEKATGDDKARLEATVAELQKFAIQQITEFQAKHVEKKVAVHVETAKDATGKITIVAKSEEPKGEVKIEKVKGQKKVITKAADMDKELAKKLTNVAKKAFNKAKE